MRSVGIGLSLLFATTSFALPPGAEQRGFRDGANHHLGDDSFVAAFGRAPGQADPEAARMKLHLQHVRAWLASQPATKPELAAKRAELLGYLDDYIAKGITPRNTRVDYRSPVFIDDLGNICAVGYLIERSVGRALPERIARQHRHGFLEDIAAAMPEVSDWVAASGMTLDELASIQPGYEPPTSEEWQWQRWDFALYKYDGNYEDEQVKYLDGGEQLAIRTTGAWKRNRMHGAWTRTTNDDVVLGRGELRRGNGEWTSFYASGKTLAKGRFVANNPHGEWKLFHESGHLAAQGRFSRGTRVGAWTFFHDSAEGTPIAKGRFGTNGYATGIWKHYDEAGKVAMTVKVAESDHHVVANMGAFRYEAHVRDNHRTEALFAADLRLYLHGGYGDPTIYDDAGIKYERAEETGEWLQSDCQWSRKRKQIARSGDVHTLDRKIDSYKDCGIVEAVPQTRANKIEALLAAASTVTVKQPAWVERLENRELVGTHKISRSGSGTEFSKHEGTTFGDADLRDVVTDHLGVYAEWPHVDGKFIELYLTLAGSAPWNSYDEATRTENEKEQARRNAEMLAEQRRMGLL